MFARELFSRHAGSALLAVSLLSVGRDIRQGISSAGADVREGIKLAGGDVREGLNTLTGWFWKGPPDARRP